MKRIIIAIFLVTMIFRCHAQDTSNHPLLDTSKIFNTMSVAMIDSIFWNISDTSAARWLGCQTINDNLSNQASVNWYLLDVNRNLLTSRHYILSGDDYKSWDATANWLIWYTRNKYLKPVHFVQVYPVIVPPVTDSLNNNQFN